MGRWVGGSVGRWVGGSVGRWVGGSVGRWVGGSVGVNCNDARVLPCQPPPRAAPPSNALQPPPPPHRATAHHSPRHLPPRHSHSPSTTQGERAKDPPKTEKVAPLYGLAAPPLPDRLDNGRIMCMHQPEPKWVAQFVHQPTTLQFIVFRKPISMAVSRWYYVIPSYQKKKEDMVGRGELKKEDFEGPAPTAPTAIKFLRFFLGTLRTKPKV